MKRLTKDICEIQQNLVDETHNIYNPIEGIYIHINEDDVTNLQCMINGLKNTPYEYGNFFININVSNKYPFSPPSVKFLTTDGIIRFHPFLYQNGKICLSILNTWTGPSWTSIQTLKSILISIQSIFNNTPLLDEPNHEFDSENLINSYNRIIEYNKFNYAIHSQIENNIFPLFNNIQKELFKTNYDDIINNINEIKKSLINEIPIFIKNNNLIISLDFSYDNITWSEVILNLLTKQNRLYTQILNKCNYNLLNDTQIITVNTNGNDYDVYIKVTNIKIYAPRPFNHMSCNFDYNKILKKLNYLKEKL